MQRSAKKAFFRQVELLKAITSQNLILWSLQLQRSGRKCGSNCNHNSENLEVITEIRN